MLFAATRDAFTYSQTLSYTEYILTTLQTDKICRVSNHLEELIESIRTGRIEPE
jgi:hypothetical protein